MIDSIFSWGARARLTGNTDPAAIAVAPGFDKTFKGFLSAPMIATRAFDFNHLLATRSLSTAQTRVRIPPGTPINSTTSTRFRGDLLARCELPILLQYCPKLTPADFHDFRPSP